MQATLNRMLLFSFLCCHVLNCQPQKYVIGTGSWGLFACLFNTLNHLVLAEQQQKIPVIYWGKECPYFDANGYNGTKNAWEYYFEPVSQEQYEPSDTIHSNYVSPLPIKEIVDVFGYCSNRSGKIPARYVVNQVMNKYIRIKPYIINKANSFYHKYIAGKKTVGIHLRGTDKVTECIATPPAEIFAYANKYYKGYQFFIATDEEQLLKQAKKSLKGSVISYDAIRSNNGQAVHFYSNNKAKAGEDVLVEALILARCNKFFHTSSNVSMAVLCMNPDLDNKVFSSQWINKK